MKKALVLGSEGNIGMPLVRYLNKQGYEVMEADIRAGHRDNYVVADILVPAK